MGNWGMAKEWNLGYEMVHGADKSLLTLWLSLELELPNTLYIYKSTKNITVLVMLSVLPQFRVLFSLFKAIHPATPPSIKLSPLRIIFLRQRPEQ